MLVSAPCREESRLSRQRSTRTEKAKEQTISKDSRGEQGATPVATATVAIGRQLRSAILGVARCGCTARVVGRGGRGTESCRKRGGEGQGKTPAEELWKAVKSQPREAADLPLG